MVKRDLIGNILGVIALIIAFIGLRVFVFTSHTISTQEANTYLQADDVTIVSKVAEPDYKDFVLYEVEDKQYVGRVVAKEGDAPVFMDDIFYLNHKIEAEPYLEAIKAKRGGQYSVDAPFTVDFTLENLTEEGITAIPEGNYLILNDDRQNKADSRQFGLISKNQIKGVVTFKVLPLENFGFVKVE